MNFAIGDSRITIFVAVNLMRLNSPVDCENEPTAPVVASGMMTIANRKSQIANQK
jgi:hypothetical protein